MQYLSAVCRNGGERFSSHAKHEAQDYSVGIQKVFGCDVTKEEEAHIHPRYIANPCQQVVVRSSKEGYKHCVGGGCAGKLVA